MFCTKGWAAGIKLRLFELMEKEGDIISGKLRKESPEELTVVSATAAATGGRGQMGPATGTAARKPCSAAALLQPSSSLLQNQKQSTASHLPPAVCCPGQRPISPVVWTSLSCPFSINIWDWVHHLAKGQSQHLLRSPAWRTQTSYFRANNRIP